MSVKKIFQILFAIAYFFLTTGFTITSHFCSGELSNISVVRTSGDEDPCGCDANSCRDSCCKDQIQTVKLDDSHKFEVKFNQNSFEFVVAIFHLECASPFNHISDFHFNLKTGDSSPPSLYLHNCSLLI